MKKILVTGSSGQLGTYVVNQLNADYLVIPSSRLGTNSVKLDITRSSDVSESIEKYDPDIIINCAALTNVDACEKYKEKAQSINVDGLKYIVKYSKKNTKIIQISTDYVFDGLKEMYYESSSPNPINYYGKTKLEAENFLRGSNRDYLIIRTSSIYSHDFSSFFSWVYKNLKLKKEIKVASDLISTPTWSKSLAIAIYKSIVMNTSGLYNYAGLTPISRLDFSKLICKYFNFDKTLLRPIRFSDLHFDAKRPILSNLSSEKIENEICFKSVESEYCIKQILNQIQK